MKSIAVFFILAPAILFAEQIVFEKTYANVRNAMGQWVQDSPNMPVPMPNALIPREYQLEESQEAQQLKVFLIANMMIDAQSDQLLEIGAKALWVEQEREAMKGEVNLFLEQNDGRGFEENSEEANRLAEHLEAFVKKGLKVLIVAHFYDFAKARAAIKPFEARDPASYSINRVLDLPLHLLREGLLAAGWIPRIRNKAMRGEEITGEELEKVLRLTEKFAKADEQVYVGEHLQVRLVPGGNSFAAALDGDLLNPVAFIYDMALLMPWVRALALARGGITALTWANSFQKAAGIQAMLVGAGGVALSALRHDSPQTLTYHSMFILLGFLEVLDRTKIVTIAVEAGPLAGGVTRMNSQQLQQIQDLIKLINGPKK